MVKEFVKGKKYKIDEWIGIFVEFQNIFAVFELKEWNGDKPYIQDGHVRLPILNAHLYATELPDEAV